MKSTLNRRAEVAALSTAIVKSLRRIDQARTQLHNLESRLTAQEAELRFQKMVLRAEERATATK
jgi:hypothetical protein